MTKNMRIQKICKMGKRTTLHPSLPSGSARRRRMRANVLGALRSICERMETMQKDRDAKAACREVASMLLAARRREERASSD